MKHSGHDDLLRIPKLMGILKSLDFKERKEGHFYFRGKNIIHFHSDCERLFADIGEERVECFDGNEEVNTERIIKSVLNYKENIGKAKD